MIKLFASLVLFVHLSAAQSSQPAPAKRIIIFKIDGLNADLLYNTMREIDPSTGKSKLPWFTHIFAEGGVTFNNFYTRGISLSAPSWSMLDTGQHAIIRGNAEYDRYTGYVYDYLNFFPFYIGYARKRQADMPGVELLDRAGIPLVIDSFPYPRTFQGFQLFQRGVRWSSLKGVLERRFSSKVLLSTVENGVSTSYDELLYQQTEKDLRDGIANPQIVYLDFYTGDIDHEGHATNEPAALLAALRRIDSIAGRIWTENQASPLASQTLFIAVSDHGMNNVPAVYSQAFSLPDFFNSPQGGGHHVVTNRHQLSDFKIAGLDPLVRRVVNPSTASTYLQGQADRYPTAWLDLDGNERASVHLRNSDLNKIHILLLQLARPDLDPRLRSAAAVCLRETLDRHRAVWNETLTGFDQELAALDRAIGEQRVSPSELPVESATDEPKRFEQVLERRKRKTLDDWKRERAEYFAYLARLRALLAFEPDPVHPLRASRISTLIPELSLGDNNSVVDIRHYIAGPAPTGLALAPDGKLDEAKSFSYIDYFPLLAAQRPRNNPQAQLPPYPVDFTALRLPESASAPSPDASSVKNAYWLYAADNSQLIIFEDAAQRICLRPVILHTENTAANWSYSIQPWRLGLPLRLFEDPELRLPDGSDRAAWLSAWHTEREWFQATHLCRYSNGVIGIVEEFSPIGPNVPGRSGADPLLTRYERRRRELVQPDFQIFAADHWNFNARNFNPGGNHGAFFRISTHSVWMMAGAGLAARVIDDPYDSLNFASTVLNLAGRAPPMPDRVVDLR